MRKLVIYSLSEMAKLWKPFAFENWKAITDEILKADGWQNLESQFLTKFLKLNDDVTLMPDHFQTLHVNFSWVHYERFYFIDFGSRSQRSRSNLALCLQNLVGRIQTTVFLWSLSQFTFKVLVEWIQFVYELVAILVQTIIQKTRIKNSQLKQRYWRK